MSEPWPPAGRGGKDRPVPEERPDAWGVHHGYHDAQGTWREAPAGTLRAIAEAMGAESEQPAPGPPLWIAAEGERLEVAGRWELHTEDGGVERVAGSVEPPPLGYHDLYREDDGRRVRLIVAPPTCHLPPELRIWGWAVQLYAARSRRSWGIGDLGDLRRLGEWSRSKGAEVVLVNPLHAAVPVPGRQQASPYYPSSRTFRSPLYLDVADVPGATALGPDLEAAATAGEALNQRRAVDRDAVLGLKLDVLEKVFAAFAGHEAFDAFCAGGGPSLHRFATHCALAEAHGPDWRRWFAELRHPDNFEVRQFAEGAAERVRFHMWLQWLLERQLEAAGGRIGLMHDLAVGVDPGGADAWLWQDVMASGVSVGAPPDEFNTQGQDWGVPPFDPWKLRSSLYQPFVETLRAGFRHAAGLRVDHVMGLFRLFWVPAGGSARNGTYVRYPADDLLAILALESRRAGAYVVGEDLGTVEDSVREELGRRDVLSYRLLWFEPRPPSTYPRRALAAVTTHDLPTVAGLWSGADLAAQHQRRMDPNVESTAALRRRVRDWTGLDEGAPVTEAVQRVYGLLAEAPSMILTATLEDALGVEERPNYPGTLDATNWSLALPVPLEDIEDDPRVAAVARTLAER